MAGPPRRKEQRPLVGEGQLFPSIDRERCVRTGVMNGWWSSLFLFFFFFLPLNPSSKPVLIEEEESSGRWRLEINGWFVKDEANGGSWRIGGLRRSGDGSMWGRWRWTKEKEVRRSEGSWRPWKLEASWRAEVSDGWLGWSFWRVTCGRWRGRGAAFDLFSQRVSLRNPRRIFSPKEPLVSRFQ